MSLYDEIMNIKVEYTCDEDLPFDRGFAYAKQIAAELVLKADLEMKLHNVESTNMMLRQDMREMQGNMQKQDAEIERLTEALMPRPMPEGVVPHAFMLEETARHAKFWESGAKNTEERATSLICLQQSVNGWKNAAYALAEKVMEADQLRSDIIHNCNTALTITTKQAEKINDLASERDSLLAALKLAEAALSDIGDADREPGDDLAWCERRAAKDLKTIRSIITKL